MELFSLIIGKLSTLLAPILVVGLLGTGLFLTLRLRFIQFRKLGHGFAVATGRYDDPGEPGDVSHFQALSTALSATVGIGNIAGVAIAIHWGGPGALFWMWMTALLGMVTKYSEVTLAQRYRIQLNEGGKQWAGSVAGGPMYYIERGLGPRWKPVAVFFAFMLMITSFMTGNAIQANTIATQVTAAFGIAPWITGLVTATFVGLVIIGGIRRIGAVSGILAPLMAAIYVFSAMVVLILHFDHILPALGTIFSEAFNPTASVAGTAGGVFAFTVRFGVQRGLFSNEAGQGSAPIAHSAARTDEPVSEGVVALLEPFIDTIIICSMTGLVIVITGVWNERVPTTLSLNDTNITYVALDERGVAQNISAPDSIVVTDGTPVYTDNRAPHLAYYDASVNRLFTDREQTRPFDGVVYPPQQVAIESGGSRRTVLYGDAVRNSSPLTTLGFERGLQPIGLAWMGQYIVLISVFLFALSTAISWSYYGDRCANYLFGLKGILPYKFVYVVMHFVGATLSITTVWDIGDTALSLVTLPNILSLILLSGVVKQMTDSYFERKPWLENYEVHKRVVQQRRENQGH